MESVGIRELKAKASEIVEAVHTSGKRYQVTRRGKPVARIVPASDTIASGDSEEVERDAAVWAEMDALAEEIGRRWPQGVGAVETLSESRR
jgi:prevent-host-death family protein